MKKIIISIVFTIIVAMSAIASAATLKVDEEAVNSPQFGPMIIKTIEGPKLDGLNNQGIQVIDGKGKKGLKVTNSRKPKVNMVVMNEHSVGEFLDALQARNYLTSGKSEGPMYKVQLITEKPNSRVQDKLERLGISEPVMLIVHSGKKAQSVNIGKLLLKVALTALI